jgi:CrcB protein
VLEHALLVGLGGAIGSALRFLTAVAAAQWLGTEFPYGTLIVNLSGAFVIGFVQQIGGDTPMISERARLFLATGMLGGYTTYSAFSYETVRLAQSHAWPQAWANVIGTTVASLALCVAGMAVGRLVLGLRA